MPARCTSKVPARCTRTHTRNPAPGCFSSPANDSPTPRAVGSQSAGWTLVAFLDSYSFPLSFSPPHSPLQLLAFFSLLPPLTFSFAPQLPSSPPSSCLLGPLMGRRATHGRTRKLTFFPILLQTFWTPTTLQPPSDSCAEMCQVDSHLKCRQVF